MKKHFSFTLVELLGVMALIVILAGIAFSGYTYAMNKAKESATTSVIKQIETGLNAAKIKAGYVPACSSYQTITFHLNSQSLLDRVEFGSSFELSANHNRKLFEEFKKIIDFEAIRQNLRANGELEDSWGGLIYYKFPGDVNTTGFDLVSAGADGVFGEIGTSTPPTGNSARNQYYDGSERITDDISNF